MFRRMILIVAICVVWSLRVEAARVYTASGKTYDGKVTNEGKKVIVETSSGRVVLAADTVIHIDHSPTARPDPEPVVKPTTTQPVSPTVDAAPIASVLLESGAMVLGNATRPEPIVYMYMRALSVATVGQESARQRRQVDLWRVHAHDRLRKAGRKWIGPKDFVRHRKKFVELLGEADKLNKLAGGVRRYSSSKTPPVLTAKQKRYKYEAQEKMHQAGRSWADPPMQNFLVGVAQMHARKFDRAEVAFKLGLKETPLLAGLHQGLGLACAKQYR